MSTKSSCHCCGHSDQFGLLNAGGGRGIHFHCWDEHHSDPTTEWPPGHVCADGGRP